jgi:bla regulator protein blaR1
MLCRCSRISGLAVVVACLLAASVCLAEAPTVAEILKAHQVNQDRLKPLHVQMTYTQEWTDAFRESRRKEAEQAEAQLKALEAVDPKDVTFTDFPGEWANSPEEFLKQVRKSLRNQTKHFKARDQLRSRNERFELFVNGDDYQIRSFNLRSDRWQLDQNFPNVPVTPESMVAEYRNVSIYSRSSKRTPAARFMYGSSSSIPHVTEEHTESGRLALPPCTGISSHWQHSRQHLIDRLFAQAADHWRIVGQTEQDGRMLTVVEVIDPNPAVVGTYTDENGESYQARAVDFYRAWLDLERGALPIQMHAWKGNERLTLEKLSGQAPAKILMTQEIRKLDNGGFYPVRTVLEKFDHNPAIPRLTREEWAEVKAGSRPDPKVVHERMTWICETVDRDVPSGEEFFVLAAFDDQEFFDLDAGKMVGAPDPKPPIRPGQPAPPLTISHWLDGNRRTLEDFRGQVVVLQFWQLDSSDVQYVVPAIRQLQEKYQGQPVRFISIHRAEPDSEDLTRKLVEYTRKQNWQSTVAIDAVGKADKSATAHAYGIDDTPATVIVGANGLVASHVLSSGLDVGYELDIDDDEEVEAFLKQYYESAGITWPLDENLSEPEINEISSRLMFFHLGKRIDAALKDVKSE